MHLKLNQMLAKVGGRLDAIFMCPHTPEDGCDCRKPAPGLYREIGVRYGVDLSGVPAVGDTYIDLQACAAAGCEPHLVLSGKAATLSPEQVELMVAQVPGTQVHTDLGAFADFLIERDSARQAELGSRAIGGRD